MNSDMASTARRDGQSETPVMRPPRPSESRAALRPSKRPVLRAIFFSTAAVGGFVAGEVVLLALAEPGGMLPSGTTDLVVAFGAALGVALLGGLLCAAAYREISRRR